jgi:hypothetical protein
MRKCRLILVRPHERDTPHGGQRCPATFPVRAATDENRLTLDQLAGLGINEKSLREKLLSSHRGRLCEEQGSVVGFAIGDRSSGEMEVIAVLPTQICRGIGGCLAGAG